MKKTGKVLLFASTMAAIANAVVLAQPAAPGRQPGMQEQDRPGGPQPGARRTGGDILQRMQQFKEANPEEYAELLELRDKDPEAFRERMRELAGRQAATRAMGENRQVPELEQKQKELARRYQEADAAAEKERIKAALTQTVEEAFDERVRRHRERLKSLEQEIERVRSYIEKRESLKDKIVERRVSELTDNSLLDWNARW